MSIECDSCDEVVATASVVGIASIETTGAVDESALLTSVIGGRGGVGTLGLGGVVG